MLKVFSMQSWNENSISLLQFVIKMEWSNRKKNVGRQYDIGCALRDNNQVRVQISLSNRSYTLYSLFHFKCTFPLSSFLDFVLYISEDTDSAAVLNCIGFLEGEERGGHKHIRLLVLTQPWTHQPNQRTISYRTLRAIPGVALTPVHHQREQDTEAFSQQDSLPSRASGCH